MAGRAFDERYDPRYQRGFDGGADDPGGAAAPVAPRAEGSRASNSGSTLNSTPESDASGGSVPELGTSGPGAGAEPARPEATDEPEEVEAPGEPELARRWIWAAFAICAAAVGLGVAWLWSGFSDPRYFGGFGSRSAWDELRWTAASALLDVGAIGAAAVAIWLGMRQATRPGRERLLRLPAVIGLVVGVGAAVLVVLWVGSGQSQSMVWTGDPARMDEGQRAELAIAQLRSSLGSPAIRAGFVALLGIALVGARAAMRRDRPRTEASDPTD